MGAMLCITHITLSSVCPSVTLRYSVKTAKPVAEIVSLLSGPVILFFSLELNCVPKL